MWLGQVSTAVRDLVDVESEESTKDKWKHFVHRVRRKDKFLALAHKITLARVIYALLKLPFNTLLRTTLNSTMLDSLIKYRKNWFGF